MPMKRTEPTLEHAFYALALALAIGLRFLHLGALPLSDYEANWALQAWRVAQGLKPAIGPNPAYVHLTAITFYIFGASNFLARFWPALAGSALVLAPWFLRSRFGRTPALVLAFGLAFDPGLVAMSHLAGGPILSTTCLVLTGLMWLNGRRAAVGFFAGLALLSGPSFWFGLLGLALTW
jgi:predicted membrane-bound mannosyltransferase